MPARFAKGCLSLPGLSPGPCLTELPAVFLAFGAQQSGGIVRASVHRPEVDAIFGPYVKGKRRAEAAVAEQFGANGVILHLAHPFVVEATSLLPAIKFGAAHTS